MFQKYLLTALITSLSFGSIVMAQTADEGSEALIETQEDAITTDMEFRQGDLMRPGRPGQPGRPDQPGRPPRPPRPPHQPPHQPPPHQPQPPPNYPPHQPPPNYGVITCYARDYYGRWFEGRGWTANQAMNEAMWNCQRISNYWCQQDRCYR